MFRLDRHIRKVEKSISKYIGDLGEKLALKYLIDNGFEVISFSDCLIVSLGYSKEQQEYSLKAIKSVQMPVEKILVHRNVSLVLAISQESLRVRANTMYFPNLPRVGFYLY